MTYYFGCIKFWLHFAWILIYHYYFWHFFLSTRYHLNWIYFITPSYSYKSQTGIKEEVGVLENVIWKHLTPTYKQFIASTVTYFPLQKTKQNKKQIIPSFNLNFVPLVTVGHCLMKAERCRVWMFISRLCTGLHSPRSITYKRSVKQHTKDGAWRPRALRQRCWEAACYFRQPRGNEQFYLRNLSTSPDQLICLLNPHLVLVCLTCVIKSDQGI